MLKYEYNDKEYKGCARFNPLQDIPFRDPMYVNTYLVIASDADATNGIEDLWVAQVGMGLDGLLALRKYYLDKNGPGNLRVTVIELKPGHYDRVRWPIG